MTYQYKEYIEELLRKSGNRATRSGVVISELLEVYQKAEKYNQLEEIMQSKEPNEAPMKEWVIEMINAHLKGWFEKLYKDEGIKVYLPPNKKYAGIKQPTNEVAIYIYELYQDNPLIGSPIIVIEDFIEPKFKKILALMKPTNEVVLHVGENVSDYRDGYTHIDIK